MKKYLSIFILFIIIFILSGCNNPSQPSFNITIDDWLSNINSYQYQINFADPVSKEDILITNDSFTYEINKTAGIVGEVDKKENVYKLYLFTYLETESQNKDQIIDLIKMLIYSIGQDHSLSDCEDILGKLNIITDDSFVLNTSIIDNNIKYSFTYSATQGVYFVVSPIS